MLEHEGLEQEPGEGWVGGDAAVLASWPEPLAVFSVLPPHFDWEQASLCALQEQRPSFLQPFGKPHWVSNQLRGLSSWCCIPGLGCPMWGWNPSLPRKDP